MESKSVSKICTLCSAMWFKRGLNHRLSGPSPMYNDPYITIIFRMGKELGQAVTVYLYHLRISVVVKIEQKWNKTGFSIWGPTIPKRWATVIFSLMRNLLKIN